MPIPTMIPITRESAATVPTVQQHTATPILQPTINPSATPTQIITPTNVEIEEHQPSVTAEVTSAPVMIEEETYQIAFVTANDSLNVRSGPGIENEILTSLAPNTKGIRITGKGWQISDSTWFPIILEDSTGWVNGRYLTGEIKSTRFCQDPEAAKILDQFKTAVANEDSALLAQLIHPERGLRLRTSWWNPEVKITDSELETLFESSVEYEWGIEDGSGLPIIGNFGEVALPLLQKDLSTTAVINCNRIESGPTAGSVRLPDGYQGINYMSLFRAADDSLGFDWGAWAVGIEQWQSSYYISFLVHYEYEI